MEDRKSICGKGRYKEKADSSDTEKLFCCAHGAEWSGSEVYPGTYGIWGYNYRSDLSECHKKQDKRGLWQDSPSCINQKTVLQHTENTEKYTKISLFKDKKLLILCMLCGILLRIADGPLLWCARGARRWDLIAERSPGLILFMPDRLPSVA